MERPCMPRFACFHRMPNGRLLHNGYVHANSPRQALASFKVLSDSARSHFVIREHA